MDVLNLRCKGCNSRVMACFYPFCSNCKKINQMEKENNFKKQENSYFKKFLDFFLDFLEITIIPYILVLVLTNFENFSISKWDGDFSRLCFIIFIFISIILKLIKS